MITLSFSLKSWFFFSPLPLLAALARAEEVNSEAPLWVPAFILTLPPAPGQVHLILDAWSGLHCIPGHHLPELCTMPCSTRAVEKLSPSPAQESIPLSPGLPYARALVSCVSSGLQHDSFLPPVPKCFRFSESLTLGYPWPL